MERLWTEAEQPNVSSSSASSSLGPNPPGLRIFTISTLKTTLALKEEELGLFITRHFNGSIREVQSLMLSISVLITLLQFCSQFLWLGLILEGFAGVSEAINHQS